MLVLKSRGAALGGQVRKSISIPRWGSHNSRETMESRVHGRDYQVESEVSQRDIRLEEVWNPYPC